MTITAEMRETRRKFIGSSDAAAICGADPWKSPMDVWLEKMYGTADTTSLAADAGNRLEPVILDWAEEYLGKPIERNLTCFHDNGFMLANLDGRVDEQEIAEGKSTGLVDGWGEPGTDEVPDKVMIQTHHQFACSGAVVAWVPVVLARFGLRFEMYRVERDDELVASIMEREDEFWRKYILEKREPDYGDAPSLDVVKSIKREPSKIATVDDALVDAFLDANEAAKAASKVEAEAKARLLAAIGDAEAGECKRGVFTYYEQQRKGFVVKPSAFRVLRTNKLTK